MPATISVMRRFLTASFLLLALLATLAGCSEAPAPQAKDAPTAVHVRLEGELGVGNMALLERGLRTAQAGGQQLIVVEIDTPGGRIDYAIAISRQLAAAQEDGLRTVAWVNPAATSAGALVTLACERVYIASTGTIGAALPVLPTPTGIIAVPGEEGEKISSILRGEFRAHAESNGRSKALAEAMVDPEIEVRQVRIDGEQRIITGTDWDDLTQRDEQPELLRTLVRRGELLSLISSEAIELGMADGRADDLAEVLAREGFDIGTAESLQMSRSETLLAKLTEYTMVLLAVGVMFGYIEFKTPGFGVAGILGLTCLGIVLVGRYMVGLAEVPHIVMVTVGAVLICVELFLLPGTLWIGLLGAISVMSGLWLSEFGPGFSFTNPYDQSRALDAAFELGLVALVALIGIWILSYFLPDTPVLRALVQAPSDEGASSFGGGLPPTGAELARVMRTGAEGVALTDLRPVGKVRLDDATDHEFEATAEGPAIEIGDRVRVTAARSGRLTVELATEETNA
jgi:membrane-bound serine protease (ClpP class)